MPVLVKPDPFAPVLLSSPVLNPTEEQLAFIRKILDKSSSDSRFADKAYAAILAVLAGSIANANPSVSSVNPASGPVPATLQVMGTNFKTGSLVVISGVERPTVYVSATELTATLDASEPGILPVAVRNPNGVQSDPVTFTVTA